MNSKKHPEEILATGVCPTPVSRDVVRGWVKDEQIRGRNRTRRVMWVSGLAYVLAFSGIGLALHYQMNEIRSLVKHDPSKALIRLNQVTKELCSESPADYFVQQRSRRGPIKRDGIAMR
ncbi:MAG: hypothetical protein ACI87E_001902 [Mariniblastus sp.]|jgi:hypothetical protein